RHSTVRHYPTLFGEEAHRHDMEVMLPSQHKVHEERNEADGQHNLPQGTHAFGNYVRQTRSLLDLNWNRLLASLGRGDHVPRTFFNFVALRAKITENGANFG